MPGDQTGTHHLARAGAEMADAFDAIDSAALSGLSTKARAKQWQARRTLLNYVDGLREQARAGGPGVPVLDATGLAALDGVHEILAVLCVAVDEAQGASDIATL